ncbi:MAG: type II toxin-antitoxin system RelE/ParE family toxin [Methylobacter sp.]|nr:type II toxin-antitoxin system RelE/ParE family toxin [Methylobacter sp.]
MQIKKTALADEDLMGIFIYGSQNFGQAKAKSYYAGLAKAFLFLAENPLACPERVEFEPSVRIHNHGKHLIIYTVEDSYILIVRVLHQRMDVKQYL